MQTQIEKDIVNFTGEKLCQWHNDAVQRCEIAKVPTAKSAAIIVGCLMDLLTYIFHKVEMSEDEFIQVMRYHYRDAKQTKSGEKF